MSKPSFVLIMTDTQGADCVSVYGRPELGTRNIDRLASDGVRFDRGYTVTPLCTPARSALFTGVYPHTNGAWANSMPLGSTIQSMGERFSDLEYRTAFIGKWHLDGHDYFGDGEAAPGWDPEYWYDGKRYLDDLSEEEAAFWRSKGTFEKLQEHDIEPEFTWARRNSNRAIQFLDEVGSDPFVLVVSYDEPHAPMTCPPEYVEPFLDYEYEIGPNAFDDLESKPDHHRLWADDTGVNDPNGKYHDPLYFGCNRFVDNEIGRVLDAVDHHSNKDIYVIYTSDHGAMKGAHRLNDKGPAAYEEIVRIPFIVRPPYGVKGVVNKSVVSHIDILPTMLELAGENSPETLDGQSLVPVLNDTLDERRSAFIEYHRFEVTQDGTGGLQPFRCIVKGRYKLVINLLSSDELYDLWDDPGELNNLIDIADLAEQRSELHSELLDIMYRTRDPFRGPDWEKRPWNDSYRGAWNRAGDVAPHYRPIPADRHRPAFLDYNTGKPLLSPRPETGGLSQKESSESQ